MAKRLKGKLFARLSLDYPDHPKIASLSDAAFRAHVEMIVYARKYELDGVLPARIVETKWVTDSVSELLTNGNPPSLTYNDESKTYTLHGYADMQETRDEISARRQVNAENGAKGGRPKKPNGLTNGLANGLANGNRNETETKAETETETELKKHSPTESGKKTPARGAQLHDTWQPTEAHRQLAAERNIDCNLEAEKMRDWARSKGEARKDWNATFRNWLRNAKPTHHPNLDRRAQLMLADRAKYATQEVNQWPPQLKQ